MYMNREAETAPMRGRLAARVSPYLAAILFVAPVVGATLPGVGPWASWVAETIDDRKQVLSPTVAVGADGRIHLAYAVDVSGTDPNVLHYATRNLGLWSITRVSPSGQWGVNPSIAVDSQGHPHIAYQDAKTSDLWYARWTGSAWAIELVAATGSRGHWPALVLDSLDRPHILDTQSRTGPEGLYYSTKDLSGWQSTEIYSNVGSLDAHLAIDTGDSLHASFSQLSPTSVVYGKLSPGGSWAFDQFAGFENDIAVTPGGIAHIAFQPVDSWEL